MSGSVGDPFTVSLDGWVS